MVIIIRNKHPQQLLEQFLQFITIVIKNKKDHASNI
jgi:hypothetical protein